MPAFRTLGHRVERPTRIATSVAHNGPITDAKPSKYELEEPVFIPENCPIFADWRSRLCEEKKNCATIQHRAMQETPSRQAHCCFSKFLEQDDAVGSYKAEPDN